MNNLLTAIMTKCLGSTLSTDVGDRIFLDEAPEGAEFPYIVFSIVSGMPDRTFTEYYTDTLMQFSIFSTSASAAEITTIYADMKALFDEHPFAITASTLVWMKEANLTTMVDDVTVSDATHMVRHWAVDYEIKTSLN